METPSSRATPVSNLVSPRDDGDRVERIRRLGLEGNVVELELRGYTVVENVAPAEFIERLRRSILERVDETPAESGGFPGQTTPLSFHTAGKLLERGRIFEEAVCNPKLTALAEYMVGGGFVVSQVLGSVKRQGMSEIGIHSDNNFMREPFPPHPQLVTAVWTCDDFTRAGGCTRVVPGSHRLLRHPVTGEGDEEVVPVECLSGSLVMWDGALWHDNCTRTLPGERVCLHVTFNRVVLRTFESYDLPQAVIDRNPPEFASMLGLDDPFGKSTWAGPDKERTARTASRFRR